MIDKVLVSDINLESILSSMINSLKNNINNKDISLPYITQLSKSTYLKIDGNGNMFLNNGGKYIEIGSIYQDKLDIDKIYQIFSIVNQQGQWDANTYANITNARRYFGCITYGSKIYCIGGYNNIKSYINSIESYDITTDTWDASGNPMPTVRYGFGCILYNNKIYCIGGQSTAGYTNKVETYDILSDVWTTYNVMPTSRRQFGCVEYNGKIYCIGGIGYDKVEVYDILSNTWSTNYKSMITIRSSFGCVEYNRKIYCIGGNPNTNIVEVYDIVSNTWSNNYNNMPTNRYNFGCINNNNKIYCISGQSSSTPYIDKVEVYDINSNTWTTNYDNIPTARYAFGCVEYNGKIYCISGNNTGFIYNMEVLILPSITFNIPIPDSLYSKLNEIITNGDGTKVFHNDGKYTAITPTYQVMDSTQVNDMMNRLISD